MIRSLSIVSGLILFAFITTHLLNLTLGIISIELLESSRPYFFAIWTNFPVELLLVLALLIHPLLGLRSVYFRNTLRMSGQDKVQLISSLLIIPLLIPHLFAIKAGEQILGISPTFTGFLTIMWIDLPLEGLRQVLLVIVVWIHGCIGLFTWLRLKAWWSAVAPYVYPLAVAIPTLALLGFVEAGRDAVTRYEQAQASGQYQYGANVQIENKYQNLYQKKSDMYDAKDYKYENPYQKKSDKYVVKDYSSALSPQQFAASAKSIDEAKWMVLLGYFLLVCAVFVGRFIRLRKYHEKVQIHYANGLTISSDVGPTLLEIAIQNDVPHANLCHGKGRCGTCRVRIIKSSSSLTPASKLEQAMLDRLGSSPDTRLACQVGPGPGVVHLHRLLSADVQPDCLHGCAEEEAVECPEAKQAQDVDNKGAAI
ncbi:MAG: hypothetical protein OFPI_40890 [Osedax symbiont Rs2]|nr:MAG: hypothetical protein OFPI_40890 [Osedax symbiont Rs2]